ncbi:mannose-1-phosphate guanylyltransferase/mannose-6-phosphate isomerase [Helicobacter didelphidarum]|uniref:mannose-1-phosphate guanylyltransferase n=1 Tax=Helicobacter didelphidarum TaxID=2040648 RepID=A0A3D8IF06_9HELI|nr:mannose-1-phosphate guanylyltransferase/mannose-6-phosphate isomerase [Helicobacter didelphidarum]RDU63466.1 mannose-1-phosphate guanylyltransferase/mannose-6-phosphate isomerase [Helicobacter didelphidarum]
MVISILCGGSGTRLWPLSRELMPKQFARLIGEDSLFKIALERNAKILEENDTLQAIMNEKHYFLAIDEANKANISIQSYILESFAKNTATALTISALLIAKNNPDEIILTLPSDHIVHDEIAYQECVKHAKEIAKNDFIVTFGIVPTYAHVGYGYIQTDSQHSKKENSKGYKVIAFHEKPSKEKARGYVEKGNFYWNSGIFCYKARVLLQEMQQYEPEIYKSCLETFEYSYEQMCKNQNIKGVNTKEFLRLDRVLSQKIPEKSIDYAIMEKTKKLQMIQANFEWNDVGSFDSLDEEWQKDSNQNATKNTLEAINSHNNLILSDKMVATIGLDDFIVVDTYDALLIAKKGQTQEVKKIVDLLKKENNPLMQVHNQAFRPWGSYTVLQEQQNYKLKSIVVKPKHRLSLQKHYHRNEHWIVVSGSAIVQIGEREIFLRPNESTYIPMGEAHRLTNPGNIDLVMIEVQIGEYLGEDDIVRLVDDYARE